jgi:hypothetical protein
LSDEQCGYVNIMLENTSQISRLLDILSDGNHCPREESTNEIADVVKLEA